MNKITIKIDGMHCSECEAHVNSLFRRNLDRVIKVKSFHLRNQTVIFTDAELNDYKINLALNGSGYRVLGIQTESNLKDSLSYKLALKFYHSDKR